ncbi:hypothetical protein JQN63_11210 [Delftia lacustris]|uniref:hypothetical protein n=1 Tax=Delftia lacustris TaxID=558537 RepID=UPI00193BFA9F|nr:hypothetical protein [Delftia lacustris]QRI92408.1 hypothetical protein JQN63_10755 [Delftia lacustris]QRI92486.1 hypothetical protein JQN63_11210 [Delftia lacustris]
MEARFDLHTVTPNGDVVYLVQIGELIPAAAPGARQGPAAPVRYELEDGTEVEQLRHNVWRHPVTGEDLKTVSEI